MRSNPHMRSNPQSTTGMRSIFFLIFLDPMLDKNAVPNTLTTIMTAFGHTSVLTKRCALAHMLPCCAVQDCADPASAERYWGSSLPQSDINLEGTT